MKAEEIVNECKDLIEQVCLEFGYDDQDKEGNDSLKAVLLKIIPAMLKDSNQEDRNLFYQMLSHTPIVVTENLTQESYDKLKEQYIGKNLNPHIIDEEIDLGEYGKELGAGAYESELIIDENMKLLGKKSFIYIQKVTGEAKKLLNTEINVPHLIHELGHAWGAEKNQFIMQDDGTLKERIGTAEFIYTFSKTSDDKFVKKCASVKGLMIEESMNTLKEEEAMANYLGISIEEMKKEYRNSLVPSNYQGYMADLVGYMLEKLGKDDFEKYRLYGDEESRNKINSLMQKTDYWKNRETDILSSSDSPRNYDKKREILSRIDSLKVQEFFRKYEDTYFPDISKMLPLEKIDNVLAQRYNIKEVVYNMGTDNHRDFMNLLGYEGFSLINQAADFKKTEPLKIKDCYHTTKTKNLSSILKNGLQPIYGDNSNLIADSRVPQIYYSVGMQGAADTFGSFDRFYNNTLEGGINEEQFRQVLSQQDYAKHQKSIESIKNSSSFEDWIKDNIYLCFDGNYLSEKNEVKPSDAYTTQVIPPKQLKVCAIKNNKDNTIYSYSMSDIYSLFFAKNPELEKGLCTYDYIENIEKLKSDEYRLEYIDLEKFCEMFPELLQDNDLKQEKLITTNAIAKRIKERDMSDNYVVTGTFNKWNEKTKEMGISKE